MIREKSQPQEFAAVPSPSSPEESPPTTYGTQTSYDHVTGVPHPFTPKYAPGQGHRPTNFQHSGHPPAPTPHRLSPRQANGTSNQTYPPGGVAYHKVWRQQQLEFSELDQQANWGYWYYATDNTKGLTYQSGADADVRSQFIDNGKLANTEDTNYRGIDDRFPVFGFAKDLGTYADG